MTTEDNKFDKKQGDQIAIMIARIQEYYNCSGIDAADKFFTMAGNVMATSHPHGEKGVDPYIGYLCMGSFIYSFMRVSSLEEKS